MKITSVEFWEGYHGYNFGIDIINNPYKANQDSKEFNDWQDGWNDSHNKIDYLDIINPIRYEN